MNRSLIVFVGFIFFAFFFLRDARIFSHNVSPETLLAEHREMFFVKQGISEDQSVAILSRESAPEVLQRKKIPNQIRNLRLWKMSGKESGYSILYLERARPREYFEIRIAHALSLSSEEIKWTGPVSFLFCGTDSKGMNVVYEINVHELTSRSFTKVMKSCSSV